MKIETEYPYRKELPFDVPKTACKLDVSYGENVGYDNCWDKEIYQEIEISGFIACTKEEAKSHYNEFFHRAVKSMNQDYLNYFRKGAREE